MTTQNYLNQPGDLMRVPATCEMTEREMLEFAAKAGGISGTYHCWASSQGINHGIKLGGDKSTYPWNPLRQEWVAFRLAAVTDLSVDFSVPGHVMISGPCGIGLDIPYAAAYVEEKIKAACLGITRAAAEIGKAKP